MRSKKSGIRRINSGSARIGWAKGLWLRVRSDAGPCKRKTAAFDGAAVVLAVWSAAVTAHAAVGRTEANQQSPRHLISLQDLMALHSLDVTEAVSPDGVHVAYALNDNDLFLLTVDHPKAIRIGAGFLPEWSPDGSRIAYYSVRNGRIQLFVFDMRSSTETQVTRMAAGIDPDPATRIVGRVHDAFRFDWSPDGKKLVFSSRVVQSNSDEAHRRTALPERRKDDSAPLVLTNDTPADWTLSGIFKHPIWSAGLATSPDGHSISSKPAGGTVAPTVNQLFIDDLRTKRLSQLTNDSTGCFNPSWSSEGIVCAAATSAGPIYGKSPIDLYLVNPATGKKRPIVTGYGVRSRPAWSRDGSWLAFIGAPEFLGKSSLFVRAKDGRVVDTTHRLDRDILDYCWLSGGWIALTYKDGISTKLTKISVGKAIANAGGGSSLVPNPSSAAGLACSQSGSFAWVQSNPGDPGAIMYADRGRSGPARLVDLYPQTGAWKFGTVRIVRWRNSRGDLWEGAMLLPPGFKADKRYPVIVDVYPLVGGSDWTYPMLGNQAMAAQGYVIFRPSEPAPHVWVNSWKSPAENLKWKGPAGWAYTVDDILSGVNHLVDQGIVDKRKMCLYGFSNGGGVVNYMLTKTHVFRCAVSVAGALSDWIRPSLLETGFAKYYAAFAGVSIWNNVNAYVTLSAVLHTNHVTTPTLLADGDNDGDFLLDTIEMYNGLRAAGDDVTLLRYPGQEHGFQGVALEDFWSREMAFYRKYLGP